MMRNNIEEMVRPWGGRRNASLAESTDEAIKGTLRLIANRPRADLPTSGAGSWILRLASAAAAVLCVALFAIVFHGPPGSRTALIVYEVPCEAILPTQVPAEPLVPVSRYESLFQEN